MANAVYQKFLEAQMNGASNIDMIGGTVKALLIDTALYTFSQTHDMLDDINPSAIIGTSAALTTKTYALGQFDADDANVPVPGATSVEAIILFIDTGVSSTSRLFLYLDSGSGIPFTPDGVNDVLIVWSASGILQF